MRDDGEELLLLVLDAFQLVDQRGLALLLFDGLAIELGVRYRDARFRREHVGVVEVLLGERGLWILQVGVEGADEHATPHERDRDHLREALGLEQPAIADRRAREVDDHVLIGPLVHTATLLDGDARGA